MKVVCINDSNRAAKIPEAQWVKKGKTYTVVRAVKMGIQANTIGFDLEEINLHGCFPYEYYDAKRFLPEDMVKQEDVAVEIIEEELELV
jgi:hypothetical protein